MDFPPGLYGVTSVDFDSPNDDYLPLDDIIGDATVVAVGESRHGSLGFNDAYLRVMRYLIEEKGFRTIGVEGDWINALRFTNEYIHGNANPNLAMVGLTYRTWRTPAMSEFLQWLRERNGQYPEDDVTFFGFDVINPIVTGRMLREWIQLMVDDGALTTAQQEAFIAGIANCPLAGYDRFPDDPEELSISNLQTQLPESRFLGCLEAMEQLTLSGIIEYFEGDERTKIQAAILTLRQYVGYIYYGHSIDFTRSQNERDEGMAGLIELFQSALSNVVGRKTILLAHNVHNQRRTDEIVEPAGLLYPTVSMGKLIDDRLGSAYVPIGFVARKMVFDYTHQQTVGRDPWTYVVTWPQSVEHIIYTELTGTGLEHAIVNLSEATATNSLFQPETNYEYGLLGLRCNSVPIRHFAGLFFIEETTFPDY